jgi:hypothetical protein
LPLISVTSTFVIPVARSICLASSGIPSKSTTAAAHLPLSHQIFLQSWSVSNAHLFWLNDLILWKAAVAITLCQQCWHNNATSRLVYTCWEAWPKMALLWPVLQKLPTTSLQAKRLRIDKVQD